jgi:hypothetical protein
MAPHGGIDIIARRMQHEILACANQAGEFGPVHPLNGQQGVVNVRFVRPCGIEKFVHGCDAEPVVIARTGNMPPTIIHYHTPRRLRTLGNHPPKRRAMGLPGVGHHLAIQFKKVHMTASYKCSVSVLMGVVLATLAACGGGSSGGAGDVTATPAPAPAPTPTPTTPDAIALEATDGFLFTGSLLGDGAGAWSGGDGGDGGSGDGGGGAGDGEFVKVSMKFPFTGQPTGTLTWKVLRSQYGITGNTGTLSIEKDVATKGGYKITAFNGNAAAVRATQSNFFVSSSGQLSGTLPLPIGAGGAVKDALFSGIRFLDAKSKATDMSEVAGLYAAAAINAEVGTGAKPAVGFQIFKLNANGTGRACSYQTGTYSDTCTDGLDFVATFVDAANRHVIRFKEATTQSQPIAAGRATSIDMLAVVRKFGTDGASFTGDVVTSAAGRVSRTGAFYASRIGATPRSLASMVGAWNYTGRDLNSSVSSSTQVAINFVNGDLKVTGSASGGGCQASASTITPSPLNVVLNVSVNVLDNDPQATKVMIPMDTDLAVFITTNSNRNNSVGMLRRYSTDPTKAPCQPS